MLLGRDLGPTAVHWGGEELGDRNGGGVDEFEDVVLYVEEEVGGGVGPGDDAVLVPKVVLGVG